MMLDTARAIGEYAAKHTLGELEVLVEISNEAWSPNLDPSRNLAWTTIYKNYTLIVKGKKQRSLWKSEEWNSIWRAALRSLSSLTPDRAWDSIRDAMLATYTRDHIGQHGYTQAHYDLLMEPWVEWVEEMEK